MQLMEKKITKNSVLYEMEKKMLVMLEPNIRISIKRYKIFVAVAVRNRTLELKGEKKFVWVDLIGKLKLILDFS